MSWVKASEAQHWIRDHALKADQSSAASDGQYDNGNDVYCVATSLIQVHA